MEETEVVRIRHGRLPGWLADVHNNSLGDLNYTLGYPTGSTYPLNFTGEEDMALLYNSTTSNSSISNSTLPKSTTPGIPPDIAIFVACLMILCCAISLVVNVIILSSICFIRSRVNNTLYISLSLAAADTFSLFFQGLTLFLLTLLPRSGVTMNAEILHCVLLIIEALRMGAIMTNILHLAALAFNHYLGILFPLKVVTRRHIQYLMVILWTVPSSLILADMFFIENNNTKECDYKFLIQSSFRMKFSIPFFTTLGLMIIIYIHIYKLVCKHQTQPFDWGHRHRSQQVTKKAIVTTIMILGSTIFGWLTPFAYYALFCEDCLLSDVWHNIRSDPVQNFTVNTTNQFLLIVKPATNFYIYAFRMKEIRGALRRMKRRVLAFLRYPQSGGTRIEMTEFSLSRARSRTSTFRRDTCSMRMTSNHESAANGLSPNNMSVRRCRASLMSRHKPSNTSV